MNVNQPNSMRNIHKLSIAPMMDCTDKHFRMIMRKISSKALLYTEMIVAQSLVYTNKKEKGYLTAQVVIYRFFSQIKSMIVVQDGRAFGMQFKDQLKQRSILS